MRTPRLATTATIALASIAFAVAPSGDPDTAPDTDTVPYMLEDLAGDANALNGQGIADGTVPATATAPAQVAEADVLGARITSQYDEVVGDDGLVDHVLTGLDFRTALPAEPTATSAPLIHRFIGQTGGCVFWVQSYTGTNGSNPHGTATVRLFGTTCGVAASEDPLGGSETISGDWITWGWDADHGEMVVSLDLTAASVDDRLTSRIERGEFYILDYLENRLNTGAVTAPVVDEMTGGGFVVIGDDIPADETPVADAG